MKKIGIKLTLAIMSLIIVVCGALATSSYLLSAKALTLQVEENLQSKATDVSLYIEEVFNRMFVEIQSISKQPVIENLSYANLQPTFDELDEQLSAYPDYLAFAIVDEKGIAHYTDGSTSDLADRDYIQAAFEGKTVLSDIVISRVTGEPVLMLATPIETASKETALLLARVDGYILSDVVDTIEIGETGYAFIINNEGVMQGHINREYVKEQMNYIEEDNTVSEAIQNMIDHTSGYSKYEDVEGDIRLAGFYTLNNNWTMAVTATESEMLKSLNTVKINLMVFSLLFLIIGGVIAYLIGRSLSKPITELVHVSEAVGNGDFTQQVPTRYINRQDELGVLANSLTTMIHNMRNMISTVNDQAVNVSQTAVNLFATVQEVTDGATRISSSMDETTETTKVQAMMVDESAHAIEQMATGIQQVAETSTFVTAHTAQIEQQIIDGQQAVHSSITQMANIQEGTASELTMIAHLERESAEIGEISRMITEISDQTNLLALNASIEAARAGEAGKGFSVVADEVRKLSEQTASSATRIDGLIKNMQRYTQDVAEAAKQSENNVEVGIEKIQLIDHNFKEIIVAVAEITQELELLSGSAQQMSANTEEVTAAMEEVSSSAISTNNNVVNVQEISCEQHGAAKKMSEETKHLAAMAEKLQQAVKQFKL
ncbi:methyl-accepting chemotaxis protein [Caryophanon latum]|uniref:Chemotaxis protein n=1 Tax=Caryophanon latum TaxID=33977 RepID=A0A1C0Z4R5_9BACL|nr:methyl-accepting chemotaxis protein [Caryophanon latum]OCS94455.1 hypothetical protein A6K76_03835 [Caryophanon latum]